jgi:eukaryotic-like serine/threonine-protein kinase
LGDASFVERFLAAHSNETHDTLLARWYLPRLRAQLAREHGKPLEAVAALDPAIPFQLVDYTVLSERAENYLGAKKPELAAEEYKKILANPGIKAVSSLYPFAHLGLARAFAQENNLASSRSDYEKFFASWEDADADVPVLKQARTEYARLPDPALKQ